MTVSARLKDRLWRHHLPLALASAGAGVLLYAANADPDTISGLSFATAWPAFALLAATLVIGPFRILVGKAPVLSLDLRRDLGIWAGIVGLLHAGIGQCVHLRGRPWLYYIYEDPAAHAVPVRHDMFGFANFSGLFAALVLLALLVTSSDAALRTLGRTEWKTLQRWNYGCFGLTVLHTFGYLLGIEGLKWAWVVTASVCVTLTALLQLNGWRRRRASSVRS